MILYVTTTRAKLRGLWARPLFFNVPVTYKGSPDGKPLSGSLLNQLEYTSILVQGAGTASKIEQCVNKTPFNSITMVLHVEFDHPPVGVLLRTNNTMSINSKV